MATLRELIDSEPANSGRTDAEVLAWLKEVVDVPRLVLVPELRTYMATQAYGSGLGKRTLWDAIREFADVGTVAGGAFAGNAAAARRSAAKGITLMLAAGGEGEGFPVQSQVVVDAFTALGNDGGNGPALLTSAQLLAIQALAAESKQRWALQDEFRSQMDDASWLYHIAAARA